MNYNYDKDLVPVSRDFISDALYEREHWTYEDCWKYSLNEEWERESTDEQLDKVENYLSDNGYMFDRDLEEYCSY